MIAPIVKSATHMVDISNRGFLSRLSPATAAELIEAAPTVYYPPGSIIFSPRNGTTSGPVVAGLHLAVTQQSLADATGSVREVVARALRELRREGAIATADDGITVVDPDALTRLAVV